VRTWALAVGMVFLGAALVRPSVLHFANRWWMHFGLLLNGLINPVVMAILFYLVITPIAIVVRWFSNNLFPVHFDRARQSYWIDRKPPGPRPETMAQQF
jgi:hypothetical protein